ncbi:MAG: DUF815 domain-containing protein, partial [Chloroflexi bacterium]|nr:DUF815 domain-containing protein [Chloroflexota bacterium]
MTSSSSVLDPSVLTTARRRADALALFAPVLDDAPGQAFLALLDSLPPRDSASPVAAAARLFRALAEHGQVAGHAGGDAWQRHLIARLLDGDTLFAARAEAVGPEGLDRAFLDQARRDLRTLHTLWRLDARTLHAAMLTASTARREPPEAIPAPWTTLQPSGVEAVEGERTRLAGALALSGDWSELAPALAAFYYQEGAGLFGRFRAFRWARNGQGGRLEGVAAPDPIRLSGLIGYDRERAPVLRNTEQFVAGYSANNVLIYGDQGSGKSSTVKALFNEFSGRGLRLIEVLKDDLDQFHHILALLRGRRERFILFVDDLSFEEQETNYK